MGKQGVWSRDKRALSPIFATMMLATIIIVFGSVAYYYSSNLTTTATNNYVNAISDSQQAISERVGFENVVYSQGPANLTIYIINSGSQSNLQIGSVFVYNSNNQLVGYNGTVSPLRSIDPPYTQFSSNSLSIGQEGYFNALLTAGSGYVASLPSGSYNIHLITKMGSTFVYQFVIP